MQEVINRHNWWYCQAKGLDLTKDLNPDYAIELGVVTDY